MTAEKDDGFRAIQARLRIAVMLSDLQQADKLIGLFLVEHLNREQWQSDEVLVTWVGVPTTASLLGMNPRTVKRARAAMRDAGIMTDLYEGGHGAGDTAHMLFSKSWLEDMETKLHRGGQFAKLGRGRRRKSDKPATLPGLFDDAPLTATKGDSSVTLFSAKEPPAPVKSDFATPHSPARAVDMSASEGDLVENRGPGRAEDGPRVTNGADKGDNGCTIRVTGVSPEPVYKPGSNPARVRVRGNGRPAPPPIPPGGQMSIMLPIDGGQQGGRQANRKAQPQGLAKVVATSRAAATAKDDDRLEELLQRAGVLLGNRADGNLAVSALQSDQPDLYRGLVRGQVVDDGFLQGALRAALATVQGAADASATLVAATAPQRIPGPPAAPTAPFDAATVATTVAQVLATMTPMILAELAPTIMAKMTPAVVTATLQALRAQQGVAA